MSWKRFPGGKKRKHVFGLVIPGLKRFRSSRKGKTTTAIPATANATLNKSEQKETETSTFSGFGCHGCGGCGCGGDCGGGCGPCH